MNRLPDSVIWFEPPIACRWESKIETLESDLTEGVKQPISSNSGNTTDATPLSTTTNASPLKSLSPRFPASKLRKKSSQKSSGSNLPVREINDFDMFKIPSDIDIYGLLKDFIVPRLPQGFSVRLDITRLKQQQRKRKGGKNKKPPKVLFLARPKSFSLTPSKATTTTQDTHAKDMENVVVAVAGVVNGTVKTESLEKLHKTRITEDFLDFDEPKEFFPFVQFEKVLKIKPLDKIETVREVLEFKLDLRKRSSDTLENSAAKNKSISRDDSKVSIVSAKSNKSNASNDAASRSSSQYNESVKEDVENIKTYMFSQLIEVSSKSVILKTQFLDKIHKV